MENNSTGPVGKVILLNGQARAISEAGTRELQQDSDIFQGDTIVTQAQSNLEILFNDETSLSQGENAEAVINTYVYDPDNAAGASLLLEMGKGVFRTVTGEIAKENPDNFKLKSPMALIGIRGTVVNSDIGEGQESIGVETIGKGHVLVVQDSQGNIQFISDPLKIMDLLAGQALGAPRNMSRQELNRFQNAAPSSVDMDPARQAELNARVDAAEAEAAAEQAEQAAQEAEAEADAATEAEEEAEAALEAAMETGDEEAIAEAQAALEAAQAEAAKAQAEADAAKAAAAQAQAEAEAQARALENLTPEAPEEFEPSGEDDPNEDDNPDTGDQGDQDDPDTGYTVVGLVEVDDQGALQYYAAAGEDEDDQGQDEDTGTQGGDEDQTGDINLGPVAVDDTASGEEDGTPIIINVLANDSDPEGDSLSIDDFTQGAGGSVSQSGDSLIYTAAQDFNGTDTFNYTIADGKGGRATGSVTVSISPVNDTPRAAEDTALTQQGQDIAIDVLDNDEDPDGGGLSLHYVTEPASGTVSIGQGGQSLLYTPGTDFVGIDSFTYTVKDGQGDADTAMVTVTVNGPVTGYDDGIVHTNENTAVSIDVLANDEDEDLAYALTVTETTDPAHGNVVINPDNTLTYTPGDGFDGEDSFEYTVSDGKGGIDTARVTVWVNGAPDAEDDTVSTDEDNAVTIDVLANDTDPESDSLILDWSSSPAFGSIVVNEDSTITYTPDSDFNGSDSFSYGVSDANGNTDTAFVDIMVNSVNDAPVASSYWGATQEHTPMEGQLGAYDPDTSEQLYYYIYTDPEHGAVNLDAGTGYFEYTPDGDYTGVDTFEYYAEDLAGATSWAWAEISMESASEEIIGTSLSDTIHGLGDSDVVYGLDGDDLLYGDMPSDETVTGDDSLAGGDGDDSLMGGPGEDDLDGGDGDDFLIGGPGDDVLSGGDGNDTLYGGAGSNALSGGDGMDQIGYDSGSVDDLNFAGITADISNDGSGLVQGHHQDGGTLFMDSVSGIENLSGSEFSDTIIGSDKDNFLQGQGGDDSLSGGDGDDTLSGGDGNDTLLGEEGKDILSGGAGNDILDGGNMEAAYFYYDTSDVKDFADYGDDEGTIAADIHYDAADASFDGSTVEDGWGGVDTLMNITRFQGSAFDDEISISIEDDYGQSDLRWYVWGGNGADSITGTHGARVRVMYNDDPGNVTVDLGNDSAVDGWGNTDSLTDIQAVSGSDYDDSVTGDLLIGSEGDDGFFGTLGNDTMNGMDGDDWVSYGWVGTDTGFAGIYIHGAGQTATGYDGDGNELFNDSIINLRYFEGSQFSDTLIGSNDAQELAGSGGNDFLMGLGGSDTLYGDEGWFDVATYEYDGAGIYLDVSSPESYYYYDDGGYYYSLNVTDGSESQDILYGIEIIQGSAYDDTLIDSGSGLILEGGEGNDYIQASGSLSDSGDGVVSYSNDPYEVGGTGIEIDLNGADDNGEMTFKDGWGGTDTLVNVTGVAGTQANDTITGLDSVSGQFAGMAGDDSLDGGTVDMEGGGFNTAVYAVDPDAVDIHLGYDSLEGLTGWATDGWGYTDDLVNMTRAMGSAHDDTIQVSSDGNFDGEWILTGFGGDDTIMGDPDSHTTVSYAFAQDGVIVNLEEGRADDGLGGTDILSDIKGIRGSGYADLLVGDDQNNTLYGDEGSDTLVGGAGDDVLNGGSFYDFDFYLSYVYFSSYFDFGNVADYSDDPTGEGNEGINALIDYAPDNEDPFEGSIVYDGYGGTDTLSNISGIIGSQGDDTIVFDIYDEAGRSYNMWWVKGLAGDDSIEGSDTETVLVSYDQDPGGVEVDLAAGTALDGFGGKDTLTGIEAVQGSAYDDTIMGNDDGITGFLGSLGDDSMDASTYTDGTNWLSYWDLGASGDGLYGVQADLGQGLAWGMDITGSPTLFEDTIDGILELEGTQFSDTLIGDENANILWGEEGADSLSGGDGDDELYGSSGSDTLMGGRGDDTLSGGGYGSNNHLDGGDGDDQLYTGVGSDTLMGGSGEDTLYSHAYGSSLLNGADDFDMASYIYSGSGSGIQVSMGDSVRVSHDFGTDTLENIEYIEGTYYDDTYTGDGREMVFEGGQGEDIIDGGTENGTNGGVSYYNAPVNEDGSGLNINLNGVSSDWITVDDGYGTTDSLKNITALVGSGGDDTLIGEDGVTNWLAGMAGDDSIDGGALTQGGGNAVSYVFSPDAVSGGIVYDYDSASFTGSMINDGWEGIDTLTRITGLEGSANGDTFSITLSGGAGESDLSWYFKSTEGQDAYTGTLGYDQVGVFYNGDPGAVYVDLDQGYAIDGWGHEDTLTHIYQVYGSDQGDDTLKGNALDNSLYGSGGDDEFAGSLGYDVIIGGDDWDEISYSGLSEVLSGISLAWNADDGQWMVSGYNDTLTFTDILESMEAFEGTQGDDTFTGNSEDSFFQGSYGYDSYDGGIGTDHLSYNDIDSGGLAGMTIDLDTAAVNGPYATGFDSDGLLVFTDALDNIDRVTGSLYADSIIGDDDGNDLRGDQGADTILGGEGQDYIDGGAGNDEISGSLGNDTLYGGAGDDTIYGGAGDDMLGGSGGYDSLYGGTGNDRFGLSNGNQEAVIADFEVLDDDGNTADTIWFVEDLLGYTAAGSETDLFCLAGSSVLDPNAYKIIGINDQQVDDWSNAFSVIDTAIDAGLDLEGNAGTYFILNNGTTDENGESRIYFWEGDTIHADDNEVDALELHLLATLTDLCIIDINALDEGNFQVGQEIV